MRRRLAALSISASVMIGAAVTAAPSASADVPTVRGNVAAPIFCVGNHLLNIGYCQYSL